MEAEHLPRLLYLGLLGAALVALLLLQNRQRLGAMMQAAAVWALIFLGVIAAWGLWEDIRRDVAPHAGMQAEPGRIALPRAADGHFYATIHANGAPIRVMVDTGATQIVLSQADARAAGLDPDALAFTGRAMTANGMVAIAPARLQHLRLGTREDRDVPVMVSEGGLAISLLGMSYLSRFQRIEIEGREMVLSW